MGGLVQVRTCKHHLEFEVRFEVRNSPEKTLKLNLIKKSVNGDFSHAVKIKLLTVDVIHQYLCSNNSIIIRKTKSLFGVAKLFCENNGRVSMLIIFFKAVILC